MRVILQRVSKAKVVINQTIYSHIKHGFLVLIGITHDDTNLDIEWLVQKILSLRVFSDSDGKMNLSLQDVQGELLVVSQFTLFASTKKGNRPSFVSSAKPEIALPIYDMFVESLKTSGLNVCTGKFGADMKVELENEGPVTIILDSKNKE